MISVTVLSHGTLVCGYEISGHADFDEEGKDIVCAAVSSAAQMTANTITEVQHLSAEVTANDGHLFVQLSPNEAEKASPALDGLVLHLTLLSEAYPQYITVKHSEV